VLGAIGTGIIGALVALPVTGLLGGSDGGTPQRAGPVAKDPTVVIRRFTFGQEHRGAKVLRVQGASTGVEEGHVVYAIARPKNEGSAAAAHAAGVSDQATWIPSDPSEPDRYGNWHAKMTVPANRTFDVVAVEMRAPICGEGIFCAIDPDQPRERPRPSGILDVPRQGPSARGVYEVSPSVTVTSSE
jgi:hypothetical protein